MEIAVERLGYQKLELHFGGRFALITVTAEELCSVGASEGDTEGLNQITRQIAGVQASAVIKPKGEVIKCSLRSSEDIDVASLAQLWNGGGHYHAAGFSVADSNVDAVKSMLLREAERVLL